MRCENSDVSRCFASRAELRSKPGEVEISHDGLFQQIDSRITKLKDGRTHLAYKAEHVVDLQSDIVVAAEIYAGDSADQNTLVDSVMQAQINLDQADSETQIEEIVADKGYHAAHVLELSQSLGFRTYITEPRRPHDLHWTDKPDGYQQAVYANRSRIKRAKSKAFQERRSELCERTFAHVCDSGGMRRTWLKGFEKVTKRYLIAAAAHNLGRILRKLFGVGKPKALQGECGLTMLVYLLIARIKSGCMATCRPHGFASRWRRTRAAA